MAAFPTQFASVASLSAPASLLSSGGAKHSPGTPGSPSGLDMAARSAGMPNQFGTPGAQGVYTSSAAAAAAAQYSPAAAGLLAYSRLAPGFTDSMYGASFPNPAAAGGLYGLTADPSAFYVNPLTGTPYDLKENAEIWRNLSQQATCFAYDPTGLYSYGYGGMDLSLAARRKNATKENTGTLKAWLQEHKKNPYPTKGEKIMLAIITKMTLTQVSTWFANARRRLKKDNKMTWSPRNKTDSDEEDDDVTNENKAASSTSTQLNGERHDLRDDSDDHEDADAGQVDVTGCDSDDDDAIQSLRTSQADPLRLGLPATTVPVLPMRPDESRSRSPSPNLRNNSTSSESTPTRPRIWSLADVLGPSTTSGESRGIADTRTTSVQHGGVSSVPVTHGLSYPMPLKPTASSALQGYVSPATAASLRHWSDRSPYPIPVTLHGGLPTPFGLHNPHNTRPNGLPQERVSINGTSPNSLPGAGYTCHPGLPSAFPHGASDRLRTHVSSVSPEEPGEIRKMRGGHPGALVGHTQSSPSSSPSPSPGVDSPLSLTAFKPVPRSRPPTYAQS